MKKINILKNNSDYNRIINKKNIYKNQTYIISIEKSNEPTPKFGITLSKNTGKAVERNHLKRQIKSILSNNKQVWSTNINYVIILKKQAKNRSYSEKEQDLVKILKKIKGAEYEKETDTN